MSNQPAVRIWAEDVVIPTYLAGEPNRNPMFLEKRVYQGSSGRVSPYPVIDSIGDRKVEERHRVDSGARRPAEVAEEIDRRMLAGEFRL